MPVEYPPTDEIMAELDALEKEIIKTLAEVDELLKMIAMRKATHKRTETMKIKQIDGNFTVCKIKDFSQVRLDAEYCFIGKTDEEHSLVCKTKDVPQM